MANPDRMEWGPTSLCENTSLYFPKEIVPALSELVVLFEVIVVFWSSTQTVFTGVSHVVPEYESSWMMISAQMKTGQMFVVFSHCVTVAFFLPFFYVRNVGDILSARWRIPLSWESYLRFCENVYPLFEGCVSWLCRTGFVALRRQMMTQGLSSTLVGYPPGIILWFLMFE